MVAYLCAIVNSLLPEKGVELCYTVGMSDALKNDRVRPKITFRQSLFWDVDPKTIDPDKHAVYVIERILELGEPKEVGWVFTYYPKDTIRAVLARPRVQVSPQSQALWRLLLA